MIVERVTYYNWYEIVVEVRCKFDEKVWERTSGSCFGQLATEQEERENSYKNNENL